MYRPKSSTYRPILSTYRPNSSTYRPRPLRDRLGSQRLPRDELARTPAQAKRAGNNGSTFESTSGALQRRLEVFVSPAVSEPCAKIVTGNGVHLTPLMGRDVNHKASSSALASRSSSHSMYVRSPNTSRNRGFNANASIVGSSRPSTCHVRSELSSGPVCVIRASRLPRRASYENRKLALRSRPSRSLSRAQVAPPIFSPSWKQMSGKLNGSSSPRTVPRARCTNAANTTISSQSSTSPSNWITHSGSRKVLGGGAAACRLENSPVGRRVAFQLARRASWAEHQFPAAVRTDAAQPAFRASDAKRAFEGADPRLGRIRGQVFVAAFAVRAQLQHGRPFFRCSFLQRAVRIGTSWITRRPPPRQAGRSVPAPIP